jgi:hypothetical protein
MTLGHSFTNIAAKVVETQGCQGLVAKAEERCPVRQSPWSNYLWGPVPNEAIILGKGLGGKPQGLSNPDSEQALVALLRGAPKGALIPESGLAL